MRRPGWRWWKKGSWANISTAARRIRPLRTVNHGGRKGACGISYWPALCQAIAVEARYLCKIWWDKGVFAISPPGFPAGQPRPPGYGSRRSFTFPRHEMPGSLPWSPPSEEGAGNAGRHVRTRSLARNEKSVRVRHHRSAADIRHSPRDGFNGFLRGLPGEPGFLATITGNNAKALSPA